METLINCPICNHDKFSRFLSCKDFKVSRETFSIVSCNSCGFRFTNPRPKASEIGSFYQSVEYISHTNSSKGLINFTYQQVKKYTLWKKLLLINSLAKSGKNILDIGCATGEFLEYCQKNKWQTSGVETDKNARNFAKKTYGLNVIDENEIPTLTEKSFDIITLWHVLEHVHDLNKRVGELKKLIKPDGTIILALPNCNSWDSEKYKENWEAYDLPRHLYHFTPDSISSLMEKHGLKITKMLPMKFDAFYISLLSEKNKTGKVNLIGGFFSGLKSNIIASGNLEKYSSLTYLVNFAD